MSQGLEEVIRMASWASLTAFVSTCWYGLHRLRADKLRVTSHYILDDPGIWMNFKTSYGIESLKNNNLGNNCPWCWQDNIYPCSVNIFKWNLYSFSFQTVTIIRGCSFPLHCKATPLNTQWQLGFSKGIQSYQTLGSVRALIWKFTSSHRFWKIWIPAEYLETQVNFTMIRQKFVEFKMFLWNVWLLQTRTVFINRVLPGNFQIVLMAIRLTTGEHSIV